MQQETLAMDSPLKRKLLTVGFYYKYRSSNSFCHSTNRFDMVVQKVMAQIDNTCLRIRLLYTETMTKLIIH